MKSSVAAIVLGFAISALLTPWVRRLALRLGATDQSGGRRVHVGSIPRLGGIAIAAAFLLSLTILNLTDSSLSRRFFEDPYRILGLAVGGGLMVILGVLDDVKGARASLKLAFQIVAAVVAYYCGYAIEAVSLPMIGKLEMGAFALPLTVMWFLGVINALNLIDGLDGLAAGIALFACVTNLVVGFVNQGLLVILVSSALVGSIAGFLLYNFNPASIFMGDTGSLFLGFALAADSLLGSTIKSSTAVAILVPVVALGIPISDTVFAIARRLRDRRPLFSADRGHIHHRLLDHGFTHRRAVVVLYGASLVLTGLSIGVAAGRNVAVGSTLIVMALVSFALFRGLRTLLATPAASPDPRRFGSRVRGTARQLRRADTYREARVALKQLCAGIPGASYLLVPPQHRAVERAGASEAGDELVFPLGEGDGSGEFRFVFPPGGDREAWRACIAPVVGQLVQRLARFEENGGAALRVTQATAAAPEGPEERRASADDSGVSQRINVPV